MEKHCALLVNKCVVGEVPLYFKDYFMLRCQSDNQHVFNRCTRSSITDSIFPKFHLDVADKSFYYHGACTFNSLPTNIKILPPKDVSRLSPIFILRLFFRTFSIRYPIFMRTLLPFLSFLREAARIFRESKISDEKSNFYFAKRSLSEN